VRRRLVNGPLTALELAGFAIIVGAFVGLFALLGLEAQTWESFALLAAALAALVAYRVFLTRRRIDG
jgi:hypothetical protein